MQEESFKSRYFTKIISSVAIAVLNMAIQMILPRAFSVEEFGYYSYNLNVFTSVVVLANLSTSNALVAKFSKRNDEIGLVTFYLKFYGIETIVLTIGIMALFPIKFMQESFVGQTLIVVLLGLEAAAANKFLSDVISLFDSMAIVRVTAAFQTTMKVILCIYVIALYALARLNLCVFYVGQTAVTVSIAVILLVIALKYQRKKYTEKKARSTGEYIKEYAEFCAPLIASGVFAQLVTILMNWCLMKFSGATEQALFGAAWQLNTLVNYVFSPYAELSKREYALNANDRDALSTFYEISLRRILWITAYFACFIGFCSNWILRIVYGEKYAGAEFVTLLIMIYTAYQAWGQMSGSFMLGTERTKLSAFLGVLGQITTMVLVFIFQIPNFIWPEGLGSNGIAWVYAVGGVLGVNLNVYLTTHAIGMNSIKMLGIQILPVTACSLCAYGLNTAVDYLFLGNGILGCILKLLFAGIIYTIVVAIVVYAFPNQIGLDRAQIRQTINRLKKKHKV